MSIYIFVFSQTTWQAGTVRIEPFKVPHLDRLLLNTTALTCDIYSFFLLQNGRQERAVSLSGN